MARQARRALLCMLLFCVCCVSALAQMGQKYGTSPLYGPRPELGSMDNGLPKALDNVGIDQKLGEQVPLDLMFRDEGGREVRLGEYFNQGRPVIISLVYYECPMLCNQVLNGLAGSLKTLSFDVGKEFDVVTVSFDARETPQLAAAKKASYMARYGRAGAEKGWHFLTGDQKNINALTQAVGFRYAYDESTNQFAHASGIMLATPEGKLARYFYGIEYAPKDMRLSIVEASANKVGSPVDTLMLYCFHYDPATGKYGLAIMNVVRLSGILTVFGIVALLIVLRRRRGHLEEGLKAGGAA
jgi:protein SCO1/2